MMHSTAHAMHPRTDHQEPTTIQIQHHHQQPQQMHLTDNMDRNTMTLLETINPSHHLDDRQQQQQMINMIDPNQQQQTLVAQHLIQPTGNQQPLLHQMQPSHSSGLHEASSEQIHPETNLPDQQLGQQLIRGANAANSNNRLAAGPNLLRQRTQIEGIVTEGGGPIVQWLLDNYEIADGESLPRSTVYNHYLSHCRQLQIASVNAASFGKLIRSVFIGLKTRRLGTRGHSKYHYFGVRAKQHVQQELLRHQEEGQGCSRDYQNANNDNSNQNSNESESDSTGNGMDCGRLSSASSNKRAHRDSSASNHQCSNHRQNHIISEQMHNQSQQHHIHLDSKQNHGHSTQADVSGSVYYSNGCSVNGYSSNSNGNNASSTNHDNEYCKDNTYPLDPSQYDLSNLKIYLGANWTTLVDEHWPQRDDALIESQLIKTGQSNLKYSLDLFESKYKEYYKRMVEMMSELKFQEVDQLWQEFWHPIEHVQPNEQDWSVEANQASVDVQTGRQIELHNSNETGCQINYQQRNSRTDHLTFTQLHELTSHPAIIERVNQIDYNLYQAIESFLIPDLLTPMPRVLARYIRQFAKNIPVYIESAVKDYDTNFMNDKCKSARAFGSALRRYTSLNHLSTASRAIWEKRSSLAQMSIDLSRVDLRDIEHQVSLMSQNNVENLKDKLYHSTNDASLPDDDVQSLQSRKQKETIDEHGPRLTDDSSLNNQNYHHHNHHVCAMQPAQLIQNFLYLLEDPYPATRWPDWCKNLVDSRVCGLSMEEARNFVLKWNFYISLIMKELTLRSAPSFGSFQLIRLLFDEYIFYLVVSRLAQAQHKTRTQLLCT